MEHFGSVGVDVVAALFGVSERTILTWRKLHGLPFKKIGGVVRFDMAEVREWFKAWRGNGSAFE
jgi:excisionase family DNA binding protein